MPFGSGSKKGGQGETDRMIFWNGANGKWRDFPAVLIFIFSSAAAVVVVVATTFSSFCRHRRRRRSLIHYHFGLVCVFSLDFVCLWFIALLAATKSTRLKRNPRRLAFEQLLSERQSLDAQRSQMDE